ncbi:transposase [Paractinoplanes brasiliensis]|uniref:transposase n=1 Tax=Paractinoplanes brasiliensis TaxID=52695 RepID=UPI00105F9652
MQLKAARCPTWTRSGQTTTSRLIREEFPEIRTRIPTLWTNSYFVATIGGAILEIVNRYVENQRNVWPDSPPPRRRMGYP